VSTQSHGHWHDPFVAAQLSDGDPYELSSGHPIYCTPAGRDHAASSAIGARLLATNPGEFENCRGVALADGAGVLSGYHIHTLMLEIFDHERKRSMNPSTNSR